MASIPQDFALPQCSADENFGIDFTGWGIFHFVGKSWRRDVRRRAADIWPPLEEAELLRAVADQEVLGLLIVIEHHLVGLAADTRLLIAPERRMRRIGVVAVGPNAAGLDRTPEPVAAIGIAAPYPGAEAVQRVIGDRQCLVVGLEGGDRDNRAENLLLEDSHLVVAMEHG